jgi:hypothetical protein
MVLIPTRGQSPCCKSIITIITITIVQMLRLVFFSIVSPSSSSPSTAALRSLDDGSEGCRQQPSVGDGIHRSQSISPSSHPLPYHPQTDTGAEQQLQQHTAQAMVLRRR